MSSLTSALLPEPTLSPVPSAPRPDALAQLGVGQAGVILQGGEEAAVEVVEVGHGRSLCAKLCCNAA